MSSLNSAGSTNPPTQHWRSTSWRSSFPATCAWRRGLRVTLFASALVNPWTPSKNGSSHITMLSQETEWVLSVQTCNKYHQWPHTTVQSVVQLQHRTLQRQWETLWWQWYVCARCEAEGVGMCNVFDFLFLLLYQPQLSLSLNTSARILCLFRKVWSGGCLFWKSSSTLAFREKTTHVPF